MENDYFLGRGWSFPPQFDPIAGEAIMNSGEANVSDDLQVILTTMPGERPMLPQFGCDLHRFAFGDFDHRLLTQIQNLIHESLLLYEPRISVNSVSVVPQDNEPGMLNIQVDYTVRQTNSRYNKVFSYYLNEASALLESTSQSPSSPQSGT